MSHRDAFFRHAAESFLGLSFDDVLLKLGHSTVQPRDVSVAGRFSRNVPLQTPIVSSPMDTVTDRRMAIAMAELGGLGIIHASMGDEVQAKEVDQVKRYRQGMVKDARTVLETDTIAEVQAMRKEHELLYHSFPVLSAAGGPVVGLLTRNHFELWESEPGKRVGEVMHRDPLSANPGTSKEAAFELMRKHGKTVLLLLGPDRLLVGMYVFVDLVRARAGSASPMNVDSSGRLRVGAAVSVAPSAVERAKLLIAHGVDVIVVDSAHGDSQGVHGLVRTLKALDSTDVVAGNVSTFEAAAALVTLGVDGIRVGNGPGSICTTRIQTGAGRCQLTAINECACAVAEAKAAVPVCADGGIKHFGDVTKALAAGASSVMVGSMLAGTDEAPGDKIETPHGSFKRYRGMGSAEAMAASSQRYSGKRLPEGVSASVRYEGPVARRIQQMVDGLRGGMGYCGAASLGELHAKAQFERITTNGLRESHPHDVIVTEEGQ